MHHRGRRAAGHDSRFPSRFATSSPCRQAEGFDTRTRISAARSRRRGWSARPFSATGKPVYTGICEASLIWSCPYGQQTTSAANFDQWYNDVAGINLKRVTKLTLTRQPDDSYYFPDAQFFPVDGMGWVAAGTDTMVNGHNFGFTSEIRTWFEFRGNESLSFSGMTTYGCSSMGKSPSIWEDSIHRSQARLPWMQPWRRPLG